MGKTLYASMAERLLQNVRFTADPGEPDEHWLWTGSLTRKGYGTLNVRRDGRHQTLLAHRVSYETFIGPIPEGTEIDHDKTGCSITFCIRPACLCAVTGKENLSMRTVNNQYTKEKGKP